MSTPQRKEGYYFVRLNKEFDPGIRWFSAGYMFGINGGRQPEENFMYISDEPIDVERMVPPASSFREDGYYWVKIAEDMKHEVAKWNSSTRKWYFFTDSVYGADRHNGTVEDKDLISITEVKI